MREAINAVGSYRHLPVILTIVLSFWALVLPAISPANADEKDKEYVTLTGEHENQQFSAGENVEITNANIADDVFAAGRDLTFDGVTAKQIIAAGMSISLKDVVANDLILAGRTMELSGDISDDVIAAVCPFCPYGGKLHISDSMQIADDARLAGRDIVVDGRIGGDLHVVSKKFRLSGEILGTASIESDRIVLAPSARIGGDLLYTGSAKPELSDGAVVSGHIRQLKSDMSSDNRFAKYWIWYVILFVLGILMALFLLGAALQFAVPGLLTGAAATVVDRKWVSLGRGVALTILLPAAVALLMATVVGVPIGMVTMAAFVVLLALAFVAISYCIGLYLRKLFGNAEIPSGYWPRTLWTAVGILTLIVIAIIPFIGWAILVLAVTAGLGAVISKLGPLFRNKDAQPTTT